MTKAESVAEIAAKTGIEKALFRLLLRILWKSSKPLWLKVTMCI